ncbi:hypothetical protein MA16_Dca010830 [Dendrobium catenatum]|uniref:Uncharacterized protein n=1 Tax=Dendrobium catenatum TaxID=906689 RepID=A0A2I0W5B9_9ASPA|nr:hypothetical protein MA16_Dca010830 [Dendrobium catenatum]
MVRSPFLHFGRTEHEREKGAQVGGESGKSWSGFRRSFVEEIVGKSKGSLRIRSYNFDRKQQWELACSERNFLHSKHFFDSFMVIRLRTFDDFPFLWDWKLHILIGRSDGS